MLAHLGVLIAVFFVMLGIVELVPDLITRF